MNQRSATLKLRAATLVACGSVLAAVACGGGDDTTATPPEGGTDSSMMQETGGSSSSSSSGGGTDSGGMDSTTMMEASTMDSPADRASEASLTDATNDRGGDTGARDGGDGGGDAAAEAEASTPPLMPLNLCPTLDTDYATVLAGTPEGDLDARLSTWGSGIELAFALALSSDCRVNGVINTFDDAGMDQADYLNQLSPWIPLFFGCGPLDGGALTYAGLIPPNTNTHTYTVADLNVISQIFEDTVVAQASINWASNVAMGEFMTIDQLNAMEAQLAALQANYPANPNTTRLTFSTCASDAGAEGGSDGGSEGGADAGSDAAGD